MPSKRKIFWVCGITFVAPACVCIFCLVLLVIGTRAGIIPNYSATGSFRNKQTQTQKAAILMTATVQTFTPQPTKSLIPTFTPQPTIMLNEETALALISESLGGDVQVGIVNNTFIAETTYSDDEGDRSETIGSVVGAVTSVYESNNITARKPNRIQISFLDQNLVILRVIISYSDAVQFINGEITFNEFIAQWTIQ